jgi:ribosomal protein L11 methyltransferase
MWAVVIAALSWSSAGHAALGRTPARLPRPAHASDTAADLGSHELVSIVVPTGIDTEVLAELLSEMGALYVAIQDTYVGTENEAPIVREVNPALAAFERGDWPPRFNYWSNCTVEAGFQLGWPIERTLDAVEEVLGAVLPRQPARYVPSKDWVVEVQKSWPPILVGELYIRFPWHQQPMPAQAKAMLVLEPGMAFGTGEHQTTRLCCEWLQREVSGRTDRAATEVLDFGSGSGILAFSALAFGASRATLVDTDREANRVAAFNAMANGLADRVLIHTPDDAPAGRTYPLVVANILAPTLVELAPVISAATAPGGRLAMSGILARQEQLVKDAFADAFEFDPTVEMNDWVLVSGTRRA